MFHCRDCGSSYTIEFEGGAKETQIGDENVFRQINLNEKFMPPTYDCKNQGYYFHEFILCEDCLKNSLDNQTIIYKVNDYPPFENLFYLNNKFSELIKDIAQENIDGFISKIDLNFCQQLHPEAYKETIGQKLFKLTSHKNELTKNYIKKAKLQIGISFEDYIKSSENYLEVVKEYSYLVSPYEQESKNLLNNSVKKYYREIDLSQTVNLNPYICYESTVRKRVVPLIKFSVFDGAYNIPTAKLKDILSKSVEQRLILTGTPAFGAMFDEVYKKVVTLGIK
jgi:hypothetical protein